MCGIDVGTEKEIAQRVLDEVNKTGKFDLSEVNIVSRDEFSNLYDSGKTFWQVKYRDLTQKFTYEFNETRFIVVTEEDKNKLEEAINEFTKRLIATENEILDKYYQRDKEGFKHFCKSGGYYANYGICNFDTFERNKEEERQEEREALEREKEEYPERWDAQGNYIYEEGPYGGAFSSWDDYYKYRY